jgi:hypothetical protein
MQTNYVGLASSLKPGQSPVQANIFGLAPDYQSPGQAKASTQAQDWVKILYCAIYFISGLHVWNLLYSFDRKFIMCP